MNLGVWTMWVWLLARKVLCSNPNILSLPLVGHEWHAQPLPAHKWHVSKSYTVSHFGCLHTEWLNRNLSLFSFSLLLSYVPRPQVSTGTVCGPWPPRWSCPTCRPRGCGCGGTRTATPSAPWPHSPWGFSLQTGEGSGGRWDIWKHTVITFN